MPSYIKFGTRVRAKVPTITGWKGTGTYIGNFIVLMDGRPPNRQANYLPEELTIMRDQTPNPEHEQAIRDGWAPAKPIA